jgi:hypothetical protein
MNLFTIVDCENTESFIDKILPFKYALILPSCVRRAIHAHLKHYYKHNQTGQYRFHMKPASVSNNMTVNCSSSRLDVLAIKYTIYCDTFRPTAVVARQRDVKNTSIVTLISPTIRDVLLKTRIRDLNYMTGGAFHWGSQVLYKEDTLREISSVPAASSKRQIS